MRLQKYILLRTIQVVLVVFVVIALNFVLIHLAPGDIGSILAGETADPEYLATVRSSYGLDRPLGEQLLRYFGRILTGDLGQSYRSHAPVLDVILPRIPATLLLVGTSLVISVAVGTLIGSLIAQKPGSWLDTTVSTLSVALFSIPVFWLGLMLILVFAVMNRWLPSSGMTTPGGVREGWPAVLDVARHLVLPAISLSAIWIGQYIRIAKTAVSEALSENYITTARAIGFPERDIVLRDALSNALLPIVTVFGLQLGLVLTGAVLTETVFSWPGLGRLIYEAILTRDTPVIIGAFILMSLTVGIASLATDLLYAVLDPRIAL
ncbi:ABC transporter permease [Microvirga antarctica]|uniref:ABC transporter permease n=1 Tax=Microvirga antarctica TaxID=2819233 RepID=UPI001B30AC72|nr:ABC transporter permease [Microvirga antarctica]